MVYRPLNNTAGQAPQAPVSFDISIPDVITITARLAQILAEEVDLLQQMKIQKISALQDEKQRLTRALDIQKKLIARNPQALAHARAEDMEDLRAVTQIFNEILTHNHRQLRIARDVNQKLVEAICEVVTENTRHPQYDTKGNQSAQEDKKLSITLDQTA